MEIMKKIIFFTILTIISLNLVITAPVQADSDQLLISNIKIGELKETYVQVTWQTNKPATSQLYFGLAADNLPFFVGGTDSSRVHSADLTGLQKNKSYYFKIIALGDDGGRAESYINYIDTKNMPLTNQSADLIVTQRQAIHNAFALFLTTTRPVNLEIRYGSDLNKLDKTWRQGNFNSAHQIYIRGLQADTRYYYQIIAKDKDGNVSEYTDNIKTVSHNNYDTIKISNLVPESKGQMPLMPEQAFISWETNVLSTAELVYGLSPDKLNSRTVATPAPGDTKHQVVLEKLKPDTIYYYKIKLKSELNKKNFESQIYSLQTTALSNDYLGLHYHNGDLVSYQGKTYLLFNESKFRVYDNESVNTQKIKPKNIASAHFSYYEEDGAYWGAFYDGQVVKEEKGNTVYLIDGQYKRPIANWSVFTYLNYQAKDIVTAKRGQLSKYKNGAVIKHSQELTGQDKISTIYNNKLVKSESSSAVYILVNGKKLPFIDEDAFINNGFNFSQVKIISDNKIENLPLGMPIL